MRGSHGASASPSASRLQWALLDWITIGERRNGERVYAAHCRQAPGGCEARVAVFSSLIASAAEEFEVDPYLLGAMAVRESGLDPSALGRRGEAGILQLHPRGGGHDVRFVQDRRYRRRCLESVEACQREVVERAASILRESIQRCGSVEAALGRYASGRCNDELGYIERALEQRDALRASAEGD